MKTIHRLIFAAAVASNALACAAADFPERSITMIVPASPGGGTDTFGRKVAEAAEKILNQTISVENRGGGGGTVGITQALIAKPDGYTVAFVWNSPLTAIPHSLNVPYKRSDYAALMSIGYSAYTICAAPDFPAKNGAELLAELKKNPGKYTLGNDGVGGTMQLAGERIFAKAGVKVRPVTFKGAGDTAKAFLGGHIDLYGGSIPPIQEHARAGKAKCLLMTSADANKDLPGASGLKELGLADEETVLWWGLIVPAQTPQAIRNQLEKVFMQAAATESVKSIMGSKGATNKPLGAVATNQLLDKENAALGQVAKAVGLSKK
jgi:tripartite-type tricarboxylate transporter receptor subunit TctC